MLKKEKLRSEEKVVAEAHFTVQAPGARDLARMDHMRTGGEEDPSQEKRLAKIAQSLIDIPSARMVTTEQKEGQLSKEWEDLFKLFTPTGRVSRYKGTANVKENIYKAFESISAKDPIKRALLAVHSKPYIFKIMDLCIDAQSEVLGAEGKITQSEDEDVVIQPYTFEVLMRDFVTTVNLYAEKNTTAVFSVGLPTHHAHRNRENGFCIFNKTAMLMEYFRQPEVIICGLDINADNGLLNCLKEFIDNKDETSVQQVITHFDIYDSQVWPQEIFPADKKEKLKSVYEYIPFNLMEPKNVRGQHAIHPVLQKVIDAIRKKASVHKNNLAIYVPLGWDSHEGETASCGRVPFKKAQDDEKYRRERRFSDADFKWFYEQLMMIKKDFNVQFLYIGLEGGYTQKVYLNQGKTLVQIGASLNQLQQNKKQDEGKTNVHPEIEDEKKKKPKRKKEESQVKEQEEESAEKSAKKIKPAYPPSIIAETHQSKPNKPVPQQPLGKKRTLIRGRRRR